MWCEKFIFLFAIILKERKKYFIITSAVVWEDAKFKKYSVLQEKAKNV